MVNIPKYVQLFIKYISLFKCSRIRYTYAVFHLSNEQSGRIVFANLKKNDPRYSLTTITSKPHALQ